MTSWASAILPSPAVGVSFPVPAMQVVPFSPDCVGVILLSYFRKRKKYIRESTMNVEWFTFMLLTERKGLRDITHVSELDDEMFIWWEFSTSSLAISSDIAISSAICSCVLFMMAFARLADDSVWFVGGSCGSGLSGGPPNSSAIKRSFSFHSGTTRGHNVGKIPISADVSGLKSAIILRVKESPLGGGKGGGSSSFSDDSLLVLFISS